MKENVLELLVNKPSSSEELFNRALALYSKSKNHNTSLVRFLNSMGYSPDRLENLIYELKKLHNISDIAIASSKKKLRKLPNELREKANFYFSKFSEFMDNLENSEMSAEELSQFTNQAKIDIEAFKADDIPENIEEHFKVLEDLIQDKIKEEAAKQNVNKGDENLEEQNADTKSEIGSDEIKTTPEEIEEQKEAAAKEKQEFLKDLAAYDVEAHTYNDKKSFVAILSDYINKDPKNWKGETLNSFIEEAKKNFATNS